MPSFQRIIFPWPEHIWGCLERQKRPAPGSSDHLLLQGLDLLPSEQHQGLLLGHLSERTNDQRPGSFFGMAGKKKVPKLEMNPEFSAVWQKKDWESKNWDHIPETLVFGMLQAYTIGIPKTSPTAAPASGSPRSAAAPSRSPGPNGRCYAPRPGSFSSGRTWKNMEKMRWDLVVFWWLMFLLGSLL